MIRHRSFGWVPFLVWKGKKMRELYKAYAAKERENYIQLLKELTKIPSPSYHELEIAEYI